LGITPGPVMAAADIFSIRIAGKGGHGALPHQAVDPVLAAAHVITAVQSIVARNVHPQKTAVISVTQVQGGDAFNVIPMTVQLSGTIRTFEPAVRSIVLDRFFEVVGGVSRSMGCEAKIEVESITPAVTNDPVITKRVQSIADSLQLDHQMQDDFSTMVSEDMAVIMQEIPGCFIFVGSANPEENLDAPHHHPKFDIDEKALTTGSALMAASAATFLKA